MASPGRSSDRNRDSYFFDAATGTYIPTQRRPSHPPPLPPKELDSFITKETHHGFAAELEGDSDIGRLSLDEKPNPRRRPPRQKRKLRVLSLDGGGIRGYSTLVILGELMHQIFLLTNNGKGPATPSDLPRPCDYFDLIGGTGTGGLIALMLGRMRMDIESCKEYYVELTRYVFITDKTLLGVPYGKTLFKSSRLEEAIRHCVRESTRFDYDKIIPHSPPPKSDGQKRIEHRRSNSWRTALNSPVRRRASSLDREEHRGRRGSASNLSRRPRETGNAEAPLLDPRAGACKTFVTAVYKGTAPTSSNPPALLRTYPSRAESAPSYNCTIWQAGRATSATLSAFKPITIGQNTFLDEGSGRYNPAQQVLEEAHINEFSDDDIAVFVSIGTGKRPDSLPASPGSSHRHHHHSHSAGDRPQWWEGIISAPFEEFTEARRKLMAKLDDCEHVHRALIDPEDGGRPGLAKMGVAREDYYRFNVEVGVGEFALNEWNRLPEVSTNTRRYIAQRETSKLVRECAQKMVTIEKRNNSESRQPSVSPAPSDIRTPSGVVELPAEIQAEWKIPTSPPHGPHPSQRPFSPIEQIVAYPTEPPEPPVLPPKPPKPVRASRPLYPEPVSPRHVEHPYYEVAAGAPNPEIRVTSPTTVAGDSDDERRVAAARRRRRSNSGGRRR